MTKLVGGIRPYFHVVMIGIFHLISGFFEIGLAATQGQYFSGFHLLLNIYRQYLEILGWVTIIIGILLFCRINLARVVAIVLAWWNLFTAPIIDIWWYMYVVIIKKFLVGSSSFPIHLSDFTSILIMTLIRIYIIRILSISRAGYIFIKRSSSSTS